MIYIIDLLKIYFYIHLLTAWQKAQNIAFLRRSYRIVKLQKSCKF